MSKRVKTLEIKYIPDVVTKLPVIKHTCFPSTHSPSNNARTSIGTPTDARINSIPARLIRSMLMGLRTCNVKR